MKSKINLSSFANFNTDESVAQFKTFKKKITGIYGGEAPLNNRFGQAQEARGVFNLSRREDLQVLLQNSFNDPVALSKVSRQLHNIDPNYAKIISYHADMFFVRYTVMPVLLDRTQEIQDDLYKEIYNEMIEIVDGMTLEIAVPDALKELFITGAVYLTAYKNNATKTISLIVLPFEYCRTVLKTALGTNLIEFNFEYFDLFTLADDKKRIFEFLPPEFEVGYNRYKKGETMGPNKDKGWLELDPRFSTSIMANEKGIPPLINAMEGIFEYDRVRDAETVKSENQLKKLFVQTIPVDSSGELIFDLDEVREIHAAVSRIVKKHDGLDALTVFGKAELMSLQEESSVENKAIIQAYQAVFNSSGLNAELFMGKTDTGVKSNLKIDKASVWRFVVEINNYVNLVLNQLYNFKPMQAEVSLLPITVIEEEVQVKYYRENAAYGVGKLDAIVATGVKQKHLSDRAKLEDVLQLDTLLRPLQSSHTLSGSQGQTNNSTTSAGSGEGPTGAAESTTDGTENNRGED